MDDLEILLKHKIDVNVRSYSGATALIMASLTGQIDSVKLLLSYSHIDVNAQHPTVNNTTALLCAAYCGHVLILKLLLLNKNIDKNAKNRRGHTVLDVACENSNAHFVGILLGQSDIEIDPWTLPRGTNLEIKQMIKNKINGIFSKLFRAIKVNKDISSLLNHLSNLKIYDKKANNIIHKAIYSAKKEDNYRNIKLLLSKAKSTDEICDLLTEHNFAGETPLTIAVNNSSLLELFMQLAYI